MGLFSETAVKDAVRETSTKVDAVQIDLASIIKKLNDISLRLARIEAKKK